MCMCVFLHRCVLRVWTDIHLDKQLGLAPSFRILTTSGASPPLGPALSRVLVMQREVTPFLPPELPGLASKQTTGRWVGRWLE